MHKAYRPASKAKNKPNDMAWPEIMTKSAASLNGSSQPASKLRAKCKSAHKHVHT
jgi:hypothetical protein